MVALFLQLASKWPKWCAQTLYPVSQILKLSGISAPILAPPSGFFKSVLIAGNVVSSVKKTMQTASKSAYKCRRYFLLKKFSYVPKLSSGDTVTNEQKTEKVKNISLCPLTLTCVGRFPSNFAWSAPPCQISPWSVQRVAPAGRKTQKSARHPWVKTIPAGCASRFLLVIRWKI